MDIISKTSFLNIFSRSVYKKICKETIVKHVKNISYSEYKLLLGNLYDSILQYNYSPSSAREYIYAPKSKYVARIIPLLTIEDESFYYFITKILEEDIAKNRIDGTFGGWRLGNHIREVENFEIEYVSKSYNPLLWRENWKEFQNLIKLSIDSGVYSHAIKLDIANFYDCINLNVLEQKINNNISNDKKKYIAPLMFFLKYWNKKVDAYNYKTVGIPQSEFGDQSRLLANLYLQDYDEKLFEECNKLDSKYLRYADDQIIFIKCLDDAYKIVYEVSKELNKLGLNLNTSKATSYTISDLSDLYLIDEFIMLDEKKYDDAFHSIQSKISSGKKTRYDSFLRRVLSNDVGLSKFNNKNRLHLINDLINENFLSLCDERIMKRIYDNVDPTNRLKLLNLISNYSDKCLFNYFHYSALNFSKNIKNAKLSSHIQKNLLKIT